MTATDPHDDEFDDAVSRDPELDPAANVPSISRQKAEIVVAALLCVLGVMVLWDSYSAGAGWSEGMGPQTGYFPARIGWIFFGLSVFVFQHVIRHPSDEVFVTLPQLKQVAKVLIPLVIYIALIAPLGIYVASAIFIAAFMIIVGGSRWSTIALTAILLPLLAFWVFETQFLVPLPKGPLETALGY